MFHKLSLHAARQQRAHDEVTWAQASRAEGLDVQELPYISSCIKEVMRMYPATGGVVRRSVEELSVGGYEVPAGVSRNYTFSIQTTQLLTLYECSTCDCLTYGWTFG